MRRSWVSVKYHDALGTEDRFTEDGYWMSGDVGYIDKEEYLKLVERNKDFVKSVGEWISSVDMENEITRHPAVLEATVWAYRTRNGMRGFWPLVVLRDEDKDSESDPERDVCQMAAS